MSQQNESAGLMRLRQALGGLATWAPGRHGFVLCALRRSREAAVDEGWGNLAPQGRAIGQGWLDCDAFMLALQPGDSVTRQRSLLAAECVLAGGHSSLHLRRDAAQLWCTRLSEAQDPAAPGHHPCLAQDRWLATTTPGTRLRYRVYWWAPTDGLPGAAMRPLAMRLAEVRPDATASHP